MNAPACDLAVVTWLKVCVRCDRYGSALADAERPGKKLAQELERLLSAEGLDHHISLRRVDCLSRCLHPCNVMIGSNRRIKIKIRSSSMNDAKEIVRITKEYIGNNIDIYDIKSDIFQDENLEYAQY